MKGHVIPVRNMDNKNKFQEMLLDVVEVARVQGNQLGMNEIKELFGDMSLNEAQYEHIFAYLAANHITIKGYVPGESEYTKAVQKEMEEREEEVNRKEEEAKKAAKDDKGSNTHKEDSAYLKMYLEDIKDIKEGTCEEEEVLLEKIAKGDMLAKNRYIEANLHYVVRLAAEYKNQGVTVEDLIQEGNIGLISALETVTASTDSRQGKEIVTEYIRKFMEAAILDQKESTGFEKNILKKINYIRDAADELAEDLGREATIQELSEYIKMTEKEITDILKMSVEGVKLEKDHGHTHMDHEHSDH